MTILLDTGIVYAYYDRDDRWFAPARDLLKNEPGPRLIPAPVIPEVDYLLGDRIGFRAQEVFTLDSLKVTIEWWTYRAGRTPAFWS